MRRKHARVLTAGAAASLVLTVTPGVATAHSATASTVTVTRVPAPGPAIPARAVNHRTSFRKALRRAQAELAATALGVQHDYRDAVLPHHSARDQALAQATSRAQRRAARMTFGDAVLAARIARDARLAAANEAYAAAVEAARVRYVTSAGAPVKVVEQVRYRQLMYAATAAHRRTVQQARGEFRIATAPARAQLRQSLDGATDSGTRVAATQMFRLQTAEAVAGFRAVAAGSSARYTAAVSRAKAEFRMAVSAIAPFGT